MIKGAMTLVRTVVWPLALTLPLLLNTSCRQLNPAFWDEVDLPAPRQDESSESEESNEAQSSESTFADEETSESDPPTLTPPEESSSAPTTAPSAESTSVKSSTSDTSSATSSATSTTTDDRWDAEGPAVNPNAGDADHCDKGATTCFVLKSATDTLLASGTPGHEDIGLKISGVNAPLGNYPSTSSPSKYGLRFDPVQSRVETNIDVPTYVNQDFGIEIWYRTDPNPGSFGDKHMMLLQVHQNIWLHEWPDGGVSCYMPSGETQSWELQHGFNLLKYGLPRDTLRYVACFVHGGQAHHFSNGILNSYGTKFDGQSSPTFAIHKTQDTGKIGVGGPVQGNDVEATHIRFKGTIYMVRTWNNAQKLQQAMVGELKSRGLSYKALENLQLD